MKNKMLLSGLLMTACIGSFASDVEDIQKVNPNTEQKVVQQEKELKTGVIGMVILILKMNMTYDLLNIPSRMDGYIKQYFPNNYTQGAAVFLTINSLFYAFEFWLEDKLKQLDTYFDEDVHYYQSDKKWWHQRRWEEFVKDLEGLGNQFA